MYSLIFVEGILAGIALRRLGSSSGVVVFDSHIPIIWLLVVGGGYCLFPGVIDMPEKCNFTNLLCNESRLLKEDKIIILNIGNELRNRVAGGTFRYLNLQHDPVTDMNKLYWNEEIAHKATMIVSSCPTTSQSFVKSHTIIESGHNGIDQIVIKSTIDPTTYQPDNEIPDCEVSSITYQERLTQCAPQKIKERIIRFLSEYGLSIEGRQYDIRDFWIVNRYGEPKLTFRRHESSQLGCSFMIRVSESHYHAYLTCIHCSFNASLPTIGHPGENCPTKFPNLDPKYENLCSDSKSEYDSIEYDQSEVECKNETSLSTNSDGYPTETTESVGEFGVPKEENSKEGDNRTSSEPSDTGVEGKTTLPGQMQPVVTSSCETTIVERNKTSSEVLPVSSSPLATVSPQTATSSRISSAEISTETGGIDTASQTKIFDQTESILISSTEQIFTKEPPATIPVSTSAIAEVENSTLETTTIVYMFTSSVSTFGKADLKTIASTESQEITTEKQPEVTSSLQTSSHLPSGTTLLAAESTSLAPTTPSVTISNDTVTTCKTTYIPVSKTADTHYTALSSSSSATAVTQQSLSSTAMPSTLSTGLSTTDTTKSETTVILTSQESLANQVKTSTQSEKTTKKLTTRRFMTRKKPTTISTELSSTPTTALADTETQTTSDATVKTTAGPSTVEVDSTSITKQVDTTFVMSPSQFKITTEKATTPGVLTEFTKSTKYTVSSTLHSRISTIGTTGALPTILQDSTIISPTTCKTTVPGTNTSSTCKTIIPTSKSTSAVPISSASALLPIQLQSASTTYKTTIPTAKSSFVWPKESTLTSVTTEVTPTSAGQAAETISIRTTESTAITTLPNSKFSSISSTLKTSSIPSEMTIGSLKTSQVTDDLISSTHFTTTAKITDMAIAPMSPESTPNTVIQTSSILTSSETSSSVPEITTSYQESAFSTSNAYGTQAEIISTVSPLLKTEITEISTASGQETSSISSQTPVSLLSILSKQTTVIPSTYRTTDSSFKSANATCKTTIHSRPPETSISALSSESMPEEKITSSIAPPETVSTKSTPPEALPYLPTSLAPSTTCRTTTYSTVPSTTTCRTTIPTKELISTTFRTTPESEVIPQLSTTCKTTGTDISKIEKISIYTTDMIVPSTTTCKITSSPGISTLQSSSTDATKPETTTCRTTISTLKDTTIQWSTIPTTCRTTSAESTLPTLSSSTCKTTMNQRQSASVPSSSSVHSSSEVAGIEFEDTTSVTHTSESLADITESPALVSTPLISTLGQSILPISTSKIAWPSTTTCRTTCATTAVPSTTTCRTTIPTEIPSTSTCKTTVTTETSSMIPTTMETIASSAASHQSVSFESDTTLTGLSTTTCRTTGVGTYPISAAAETTTCRTNSLTSTCKTTYKDRPGPSMVKTQGTAFLTEAIPLSSTPLTDHSTVSSGSVNSAVLPEVQVSSTTSEPISVTHISRSYESSSTLLPEQQTTTCKSTTVTPAVTTCKTTIPTTEATTSTCKTTSVTKITFPQIFTGVSSTDLPSTVCQTACISSTIAPSSTKDVGLSTAIFESNLPAEVTSRTESSSIIAEIISTEKPQTDSVTPSIEISSCKTTINIRKSSVSSQEPILATQQSGIPSQISVSSVSPFSELDIKFTSPITSYSVKPDISTLPRDTTESTKTYISTSATSTAEADTSTSTTLGTTFVYLHKDKITTDWGPASNQLSTKISTSKFPIQTSTFEVSSPLIQTISILLPTSATPKASTEMAVSTTKYSSTISPLSDYESNVSLMPQEDSILEQLTTKFSPTKSTCKTTILGSDTSTCKTTLTARSEENEAASVSSSYIPTLIESPAASSESMAKEQATGSTTIYSTPGITTTTCRTTIPTTLVPSTTTCRTIIPTSLPPSTACRTTVPTALPSTTCKTTIPSSPATYTTSVYVSTQSPVEVPTEISSTILSNLLLPTTTTCRTTIPTLLPTSTTCRTTVPTLLPTISTTTCRTTIPTTLPTTSTCKTTIPTEFPTTSEPIISTLLPVINQTPSSFVSPISAATSQVSPLSSSTTFVSSSVPSEEPKNYTCRTTVVSRSEYPDTVTIPSISRDRSAKVSQLPDTRIDITTMSGQTTSHADQASTSLTEGLSSRLSTFFSSLIPADWRSHPQTLPTGAYSKGTEQPDLTSIFISSLAPKKDSTYDSSFKSTEDGSDSMAGRMFSAPTTLKTTPTESTYVTDMAGYIITPPVPDQLNTTAQASTLPSTARTTFRSHRGSTFPASTVPETTGFPTSYTTPPCRGTVNGTGGTCMTTIANAVTFIPNDTTAESAKDIFDSRNITGPPSKPKPCLCINWYLICLIFTIAFIFAWCLLCWQKMLL